MKCPKCGYLGFETVDRCRNCGYDFSLAPAAAPDLAMRPPGQDAGAPFDDLSLAAPGSRAATDTVRDNADRRDRAELPLFGSSADDAPLITRASPPRPPLAVRRQTPEVPRLRTESRPSLLEQADDHDEPPVLWRPPPAAPPAPVPPVHAPRALDDAGLAARALAGAIDLAVVLTVDLVVVYFTLQINGLTVQDAGLLPRVPLLVYLLLQNFGYFAAFTAGGQTLGKMAAGIQVVAAGTDRPPSLSQAVLRSVLWLILALPAGLGLASVLLDGDKRGLHDRFARTRVVRAAV
jgi:uncharacterized RDD family membrane protein YckC